MHSGVSRRMGRALEEVVAGNVPDLKKVIKVDIPKVQQAPHRLNARNPQTVVVKMLENRES